MTKGYRFGAFEMQLLERRVLADRRPVTIGARAFDVLRVLVQRDGGLVTKAELLDLAWPGVVVEEANLHVQVSTLRKHLGARAIATVPGQGYRFALPVQPLAADPGGSPGAALAPAAPDALLGREAESAALQELLRVHRMVSVVGPAGIGKTRLARTVREVFAAERGGVRTAWADLAALRGGDKLVGAIADAAGAIVDDAASAADLARALSLHDGLLVLDNAEHLVRELATIVAALHAGAPRLHLLVTTLEALKIDAEQVLRLGPLAVPPPAAALDDARRHGALQLLERRARAADSRFALDAASVGRAVALCRQLDGNPLAIEMAAARLPMLGLDALLDRLGDRLRLLKRNDGDASARHRTLVAALEWSYSLLDAAEQVVLARLSVFAGSFALDVAQQVAAGAEPGREAGATLDPWDVLDALTGLVDRSLLQASAADPPRYRLLESTRLFAAERLAAAGQGESDVVRARYLQAMAQRAEAIEERLWAMGDRAWMGLCAEDVDDLDAAFDLAQERQGAFAATAIATALRAITGVLHRPIRRRRERMHAVWALRDRCDALALARLWTFLSQTSFHFEPAPRLAAARESVQAWLARGEPRRAYLALGTLAMWAAAAGQADDARAALAHGRSVERLEWGARTLADFSEHVEAALALIGDSEAARREHGVLTTLAREGGLEIVGARADAVAADLLLLAGEDERAREVAERAVQDYQRLNLESGLGMAWANLAAAQLVCGRDEAARASIAQAWPRYELQEAQPMLYAHLALLASRDGRLDDAARLLGCSDAWHCAVDRRPESGDARIVALARATVGATREAARAEGEALTPAQALALVKSVLAAPDANAAVRGLAAQ